MNLFTWIVFGLVTGTLVAIFDSKTSEGGIISGMILGVVGALFGGLLANIILNTSLASFDPRLLLFAMLSAMLALFSGKTLRRG